MLPFSNMLNLLVDELPCGCRCGLPFLKVPLSASGSFLFRHFTILLSLKDAYFAQSDVRTQVC
jgi:hypothetical protein